MKRIGILAAAVLLGFAQSARDGYRSAYRAWHQADPNLERDSAAPPPALAGRIDSVAALAARYGAVRTSFLKQRTSEQEQSLAWLDAPSTAQPDLARGVRENVTGQTALVKRGLDTFARDSDPAIQRLKSMLDRENLALVGLAKAVADREAAAEGVRAALTAAEAARLKASNSNHDLIGAMKVASEGADRESVAWAEYYRKLADAARMEVAPPPVTTTAPPARPLVTIQVARYSGAWTFPSAGLYHGPQPEFVDMVVREENGLAHGTLAARFKLPAGSKDDPVVRFSFSGDFKSARNQVFSLETSDGSKGTIELIPGPAFNLLEINFLIDAKPGSVGRGNVVLIKK